MSDERAGEKKAALARKYGISREAVYAYLRVEAVADGTRLRERDAPSSGNDRSRDALVDRPQHGRRRQVRSTR